MLTTPDISQNDRRSDALPIGYGWASSWAATYLDLGAEYLDFIRRRGIEDIDLPSRLMACKTPLELMQEYQGFFEKETRDYRDEYAALARIGQRLLSAGSDPARGAARTYP
ncbi:hypothetical protein [Hyphomicrobium sp.]|uniref:hypothetical protein n=1 Tax=Hyphomicrobium sp. TaxID=82 RepID=UPI0025BE271E|nr:hypothetical protein [Hyphomicrobium sp.]MCC7250564.1 hypothetical protein [Hyphomicrobium sp.]